MTKPLAFIVDDDKSLGEAYKLALELSGFEARHIIDSTTAFDLIQEHQPALVMLDMQMPKVNGAEILKMLRENDATAHIKVIVATANHLMLDQSVREMATLILQKPVSVDQIMQLAQRIVQSGDGR